MTDKVSEDETKASTASPAARSRFEPYHFVDTVTWLMPILIVILISLGTLLSILALKSEHGGFTDRLHPILWATLPLVGALCGFALAYYFTNSRLTIMQDRRHQTEPGVGLARPSRQVTAGTILPPIRYDPAIVRPSDESHVEVLTERLQATGVDQLILLRKDGTFLRLLTASDLARQSHWVNREEPVEPWEPVPWPGGLVSPRTSLEGVADVLLSKASVRDVLVTEDGESTGRVLGRISDRMLLRHLFGR